MQQLLSRPSLRGFGMLQATANPVTSGISTVGSAAGTIAGALIGGPVGAAVGGAISGVMAAIAPLITGVIEGCGSTCQVTTTWANQAEQVLQQNIAAYFSLPTPRSTVDQAAAVQNFYAVWDALVANCNNPSLGSAGQNCITDREAGACHWTQPADEVPPWGAPPAGACWNWFSGYLYPIQNDTNVYTPSGTSGSTASATASTAASALSSAAASASTFLSGLSTTDLMIGGGLLLLVAAAMGSD
jgi:hypothetical protein